MSLLHVDVINRELILLTFFFVSINFQNLNVQCFITSTIKSSCLSHVDVINRELILLTFFFVSINFQKLNVQCFITSTIKSSWDHRNIKAHVCFYISMLRQ